MRQEAQVLLDILRKGSEKGIDLPPEFLLKLRKVLDITDAERDEIGEIFAADLRELNASYPGYGRVNDEIKRITQGK